MNLNLGDSNVLVKYIQFFLQKNYSPSVVASGAMDSETLYALYDFLSEPNIQTPTSVYDQLIESYSSLRTYYSISKSPDSISLQSQGLKYPSDSGQQLAFEQAQKEFTRSIDNGVGQTSIHEIAKSNGWYVSEFSDYSNLSSSNKCRIILKGLDAENRFPNRDLLCFLNLYCGDYIQGYTIGSDGLFEKDLNSKILFVKVLPDTYYTIAHGFSGAVDLKVCCTNIDLFNQNLTRNLSLYPATSAVTENIISGGSLRYKTDSTAKFLVVRLPDYKIGETISGTSIILGDVNKDGYITSTDVDLLYYQVGDTINGYFSSNNFYEAKTTVGETTTYENLITPTVGRVYEDLDSLKRYKYVNSYTEIAAYESTSDEFKAANITGSGTLNSIDLSLLSDFVSGTYMNSLLVIQGAFEAEDSIPFEEFTENPWIIHDKLLNYILDMSITPYSDSTDIAYLQSMIYSIYPESPTELSGVYSQSLKEFVKTFQNTNNISFSLGYLDVQTESVLAAIVRNGSYPTLYSNTYLSWSSDSGDYITYDSENTNKLIIKQVKR